MLEAAGLNKDNPNEMAAATRDIDSLKGYLRTGYKQLSPKADDNEVETFVEEKIKSYGSALVIVSGAYGLYTLWAKRATFATLSMGKAMKLTGVGLVVAGLGFAIDKLNIFGNATADLEKEMEKLNGSLGDLNFTQKIQLQQAHALANSLVMFEMVNRNAMDIDIQRIMLSNKKVQANAMLKAGLMDIIEFRILINKLSVEDLELDKKVTEQKLQGLSTMQSAYSGMVSAQKTEVESRMNTELDALKATRQYEMASADQKKKMEKDITDKFSGERKKLWYNERDAKIAQATLSGYAAVTKAYEQFGAFGLPAAVLVAGLVGKQIQSMMQLKPPKFATGGLVGGRSHAQGGTMIEAESGEFVMSRSAVESVGIENMNRINQGGGGVTVNVSGNVMTQDFVENDLAEAIKDAARRGTDFCIS